ncbi:MAG: CrcB protein [uncultured Sulfurovum sp.]|uniref:Fluoride-specific ion channel FluC n=1 Tax=uncultured Sulfurovum sp. TaxID=269237 RepID=A0A6S6TID6_9BACT|nr:MAG: CrcB protein [uncultured Sulfurovum sp.]
MNLLTIVAVASGGAIGATLRMLISTGINKHYEHVIPFGTLVVNLIGSLIMGMLVAYFYLHTSLSPTLKTFLITGILGALTTYSTFAMESFTLLHTQQYVHAFTNMALNLFGTIFFAGIGYLIIMKTTH